jgi:hypothetical protein
VANKLKESECDDVTSDIEEKEEEREQQLSRMRPNFLPNNSTSTQEGRNQRRQRLL